MKNSDAVPRGLSAAARRWWKRLTVEYGIEDPAGRLLLESGLRQFDRAEEARALLDTEGCTTVDRFGQRRPHPAAAIERDARAGMLTGLKALNLDIEPLQDRVGRPGGRLNDPESWTLFELSYNCQLQANQWTTIRDQVLPAFIAEHPGRRPWA